MIHTTMIDSGVKGFGPVRRGRQLSVIIRGVNDSMTTTHNLHTTGLDLSI